MSRSRARVNIVLDEARAAKLAELISFGGVQVGEIELADGLWTGMCDLSGASR